MPTIKTNFLRFQLHTTPYCYQIQFSAQLKQQQIDELSQLLCSKHPSLVIKFPFCCSSTELLISKQSFYLSNGLEIYIQFYRCQTTTVKLEELIALRMLQQLRWLNCKFLKAIFNPFQEKKQINNHSLTGFRIESTANGYFYIGVQLRYDEKIQEESSLFLNTKQGIFFNKKNILKTNKQAFYLQNDTIIKKSDLSSVSEVNQIGYILVKNIFNVIQRMKIQCKELWTYWGMKFDNKFQQVEAKIIRPQSIVMRGIQRSLAQIVQPMSQYNYCYQFKNMFNQVSFEDRIQIELILLMKQKMLSYGQSLKQALQRIKIDMNLQYGIRIIIYQDMIQDVLQQNNYGNMYLIVTANKNQIPIQTLIDHCCYFHIIQKQSNDIFYVALRHLSIVYTKLKLNPWKIKNIPFGQQPLMVISINVAHVEQQFSVAIVATMNSLLTKFTCFIERTNDVHKLICSSVKNCLNKFQAIHHKLPIRLIVFRTGQMLQKCPQQHKKVKQVAQKTIITYVILSKKHSLRTYLQLDANAVTQESVKKVQLLLTIEFQNQTYIQLEMDQSMHKVTILDLQDAYFKQKILGLLAKIVFAGVGNVYGKGLGVAEYAYRLNQFRNYRIESWSTLLKEGIMLFL